MRRNSRIRFFSINDYSTNFEQKNQVFEKTFFDLTPIICPYQTPGMMASWLFSFRGKRGLYWKDFLNKMPLDKFYLK